MLRLLGRRLGGRAGRRSASAIIDAAVNAVLAELKAKAAKAKTSTRAAAPAKLDKQPATPPAGIPPRPGALAAPANAKALNVNTNFVDVFLSGVNCTLLKHVLSSSSSSSTSTDIPDVARVLRLDYTTVAKKHQLAHLADILLLNRIHAAVVADTQERVADSKAGDVANPSSPLVVLVETNLPREDAEVQEFIIRNALHMHPLPPEVATNDGHSIKTPPLTVLVLGDEQTTRVRTLAELPPLPPRVPVAAPATTAVAVSSHDSVDAARAAPASDSAGAEETPSNAHGPSSQRSPGATAVQDAPPRAKASSGATTSAQEKANVGEAAKAEDAALPSTASLSLVVAATAAEPALPPATAAVAADATKARATADAPPPATTVKSSAEAKRIERAVRRVARVSIKALATQKKRRPATPSQARLVAAIAAAVSGKRAAVARPPRLLTVESSKETLLWASRPGQPLTIQVLEPLVSPSVYEEIRAAAAAGASASSAASPLTMHTVVYGVSKESSASTVWLGALQAAADLASAVSGGASQLPAEVAELAGLDPARVRRVSERKSLRQRSFEAAAANSSAPADGAPNTATTAAPTPRKAYVYMLIHTRLSREDAAVLQQELQYQLAQLRATPAGAELAGMSVLTADDVSSPHLTYVLEHSIVESGDRSSVKMSGTQRSGKAVVAPSAVQKLSAEGAEVGSIFREVYRLLSEQPWLLRSPSPAETPPPSSHQQQHPDTLVADAVRIAALTQVLVQRKEAQLRKHLEAAQQSHAVNADSEAVARAAQRVEMKTMVTEAVEEVSVRHEQATAHLVKTLSSMVGQWSLEKLSDTLEAIVRDQVKPIMGVLEERLGGMPAREVEAASVEATPASRFPTDSAGAASSELLARQDEVKSTISQVLAQLRELSEQTSALAAAAAAAAAAQAEGSVGPAVARPPETAATQPQSEKELHLLKDLYERQEQHQSTLREELESLRNELKSLTSQERMAAETQAPAPSKTAAATPSPESLSKAAADTVHEITHAIRQSIHTSVVEQLDTYCDVRRSTRSSTSEDRHGGEPLMPVLPVTSFELEEMLTRVVDHTVRKSIDEIEGHVRAVVAQAQRNEQVAALAPFATAASTTSAAESDEALKAALEGLWAQVRAEAAEEEAAKVSQHNRQLLRLFRRQQHLQRGAPGHRPAAASAPAPLPPLPLSYVALEEAMRVVMHPYMAQMQATVAAAASAGVAATGPSRPSVAPLSRISSADDAAEQEDVAHSAGRE
ncbi:hypothetical protein LSCM4_06478 [Leishmania orientalis]|uniref:Uncharacterized protein n=1 Tax=Leishmania orientalis TaxID=2249476 RepID=A0A836KWS7_9TRYP|nr:hypothetical protein LSCM4_06478 [Leishmania orientalis]